MPRLTPPTMQAELMEELQMMRDHLAVIQMQARLMAERMAAICAMLKTESAQPFVLDTMDCDEQSTLVVPTPRLDPPPSVDKLRK